MVLLKIIQAVPHRMQEAETENRFPSQLPNSLTGKHKIHQLIKSSSIQLTSVQRYMPKVCSYNLDSGAPALNWFPIVHFRQRANPLFSKFRKLAPFLEEARLVLEVFGDIKNLTESYKTMLSIQQKLFMPVTN